MLVADVAVAARCSETVCSSPARPQACQGEAPTVTDTQSSDSFGEKEAYSHLNGIKTGGCSGRSPSNSPFIHLELTLSRLC